MAHSFFQIITNSTFLEGKLKFPNKFVHEHGNELHDTVSLSIPTGGFWDVKVKKEVDGTIWLYDGFLPFMEDNSIGIRYFLTFKGEGNSNFVVHIFDITATEIMYKCINDSRRSSDVDELEMDETRKGRDCFFKQESSYEDSEDDSSDNGSSDKESDDHTNNDSSCESGDANEDDDNDYCPTNQGGDKAPLTRRKRQITEAGFDANGRIPKTDTINKYSNKEANQ